MKPDMLAKLMTATLSGIDAVPVEVEVDITNGLPQITVVGLADTAVQEARERIRAALQNCGYQFPKTRVTINLAPADVKKEGTGYDLPIALGILVASGVLAPEQLSSTCAVGELALDGRLRPVRGALLYGLCAKQKNKQLIVPADMAQQAAYANSSAIIPVASITETVLHLQQRKSIKPYALQEKDRKEDDNPEDDIAHIAGQELAKRALVIAAAGGHSILFTGPPGSGKTMLARSLRTLLPSMTLKEKLLITRIWAAAEELPPEAGLVHERPFRSPHHSASYVALVGGGSKARPGEISLAHHGVLFLDECAEFSRGTLNVLRQPLEAGRITVSRAEHKITYPADFQLVASTNPCPCGNAGSRELACSCTSMEIKRYQKRLTGPLLDRIDLVVHVPRQKMKRVFEPVKVRSKELRARVIQCRHIQLQRQHVLNYGLPSRMMKQMHLASEAEGTLIHLVDTMHVSRRGADRILRVARTIADLASSQAVTSAHIHEAAQFRTSKETLFVS